MEDLRKTEELKKGRTTLNLTLRWVKIKLFILKNYPKLITIALLALLIIFPSQSGHIIGTWINDFWTNLIKMITF